MVCVVEAQPAALILELLWSKALERGLRRYRHEDGEGHWPMGEMERCSTCFGDLGNEPLHAAYQPSHGHTEHLPSNSNVSAEGMETGAMISCSRSGRLHRKTRGPRYAQYYYWDHAIAIIGSLSYPCTCTSNLILSQRIPLITHMLAEESNRVWYTYSNFMT